MALSHSAAILLVDDQQVSVAVTRASLEQLGYTNVHTSASAAEAFERMRSNRYDVIFSDWHMPPMDGPELFRMLKLAAGHRRPKFYFLTGDSGWGCMVTARDLGVDGLLIKPQRPADLMHKIAHTLRLQ